MGLGKKKMLQQAAVATGKSAVFDGTSSYISLPNNPIYGATSVSFTFWIKPDNVTSNQYLLLFINDTDGWDGVGIRISSAGKIQIVRANNGTVTASENSTASLTTGTTKHIAVTVSQSEAKIYINGILDSTHSSTPFTTDNTGDHNIGFGFAQYYDGIIDDVRVYKDILTLAEVGYIYNNTEASIPTDNLEAHYKLDDNADNAARLGTGTIDSGKAADLDGTQALQTNLTSNTSAFTVAFWFKNTALPTNIYLFANNRSDSTTETMSLYHKQSNGAIGVATSSGNDTNINSTIGNKSIPLNRWTHVAVTVNGTSLIIYIDGVEDKSATLTHTPTTSSIYPFYIGSLGAWTTNTNFNLDGSVDEFRFYKSALSPGEIYNIAAHNLGSLTSTPYMYLKLDDNVTDEQGNVTVTGSTPTYVTAASFWDLDGTENNITYTSPLF